MSENERYASAQFELIPPVPCPCGMSRRAFIDESDGRASFHVVEIKRDARTHYHKEHVEIYYILKGAGYLEIDQTRHPVKPGDSFLIKEFCRHRALGPLTIINVSVPAFDPSDEYFD